MGVMEWTNTSGSSASLSGSIKSFLGEDRPHRGFSFGFGFTAIVVSLLGKRNPLKIAIAAFCFAMLITGANAMQRAVGTPSMLASVIQAVTVFFWMISEFFVTNVRKWIDAFAIRRSERTASVVA